MEQFNSEYADVVYIQEDNIVLLTWKKPAYGENYRQPTSFALELLCKNKGSNFIIDARNGFEDDKEDLKWGFEYLLPEMSKTTCKFVSFIMNEQNEAEIGEEMDMWTVEFGKYFAVTKAPDYESAKNTIHNYIFAKVRYEIIDGKREEFLKKLSDADIAEKSKQESGNITYEIYLPHDSINDVCLIEMWTNQKEQTRHTTTPHYNLLSELKKDYVKNVQLYCYEVKEI